MTQQRLRSAPSDHAKPRDMTVYLVKSQIDEDTTNGLNSSIES